MKLTKIFNDSLTAKKTLINGYICDSKTIKVNLKFYKYQGTGNDFVMIDNRDEQFPKEDTNLVAMLCHRRFGIGADGLILLENHPQYDFQMVYYNSDGNPSTMCGNGGRCLVAFAKQLGVIDTSATFLAVDGLHKATVVDGLVKLQMTDVDKIVDNQAYLFTDTGSPHHVQFVKELEDFNVFEEGRKIRYGIYGQAGSNVNFISENSNGSLSIRTYERGVEDETYSCGTGATAAAICLHSRNGASSPIVLHTKGGDLRVHFSFENKAYKEVFLEGPAQLVFEGSISIDNAL